MANKCKVCNGVRSQAAVDAMNPTCMAYECQVAYADKAIAKKRKADDKAWKADTRRMKEKAKKRTGNKGHYEPLKCAIHIWVKHVLRRGEDCYTCGLSQKFGDKPQSFHVGHFMPAKMVDPRRFMPENLRIQCQSCNVHNSGRQKEYRIHLVEEMGLEHVEWLECEANHEELKVQYPDVEDIKKEAARYRRLYRKGIEKLEIEQPEL